MSRRIQMIDLHTAGEPTLIVISGALPQILATVGLGWQECLILFSVVFAVEMTFIRERRPYLKRVALLAGILTVVILIWYLFTGID
jgi:hypothetical protein